MANSFVPVTFVADELLTSTKMNLLAANQAGFNDGTALGDGIIVTRHLNLSATGFPVLNWLSRTWKYGEPRSNNVTYINSRTYPIDVNIILSRTTKFSVVALFRVGTDVVDRVTMNDSDDGTAYVSLQATIPPGATYRLEMTVGSIWRWSELY